MARARGLRNGCSLATFAPATLGASTPAAKPLQHFASASRSVCGKSIASNGSIHAELVGQCRRTVDLTRAHQGPPPALPDANINDMVIVIGTVQALLAVPDLNVEFIDGKLVKHADVHLGFAVRLLHAD